MTPVKSDTRTPRTATPTVMRLTSTGFTVGTEVITKDGAKTVEDLRAGDQVLTKDNGYQTIGCVAFRDLRLTPDDGNGPIRIAPHALGHDRPEQTTYVSPDQRLGLRHPMFEGLFGAREVLVRARDLTHLDGVDQVSNLRGITYVMLGLDRPQLIFSGSFALEMSPAKAQPPRPVLSRLETRLASGLVTPHIARQSQAGFPLH